VIVKVKLSISPPTLMLPLVTAPRVSGVPVSGAGSVWLRKLELNVKSIDPVDHIENQTT
jgi:hypothetical protein